MGSEFPCLTLSASGLDNSGCHEVRIQSFATAGPCYGEGIRQINGNVASVSGHFIVIECRP